MKLVRLAAALAFLLPTVVPAQGAPLAWLAGCWELRAGPRLIEEQWLSPRGGMLLGMSRTMRGGTVVEYEHLRIYAAGTLA